MDWNKGENMNDDEFKKRKQRLMKRSGFNPDIDVANLSSEMARIASFVFSVGVVKAIAEAKMNTAESRIKIMKAKVKKYIKRKALEQGEKITIPELDAAVESHKQVIAAIDEHIVLQYDHNVCWAAYTAATTKANQLTNMSMNYRKELDAGIGSKVKEARTRKKVEGFETKHLKRKGK